MAEPRPPQPVLLVVAAFSRHSAALAWARARLQEAYGEIGLASDPYLFDQTTYYESAMGPELRKQFFAFRRLAAPDRLAEMRRNAAVWGQRYSLEGLRDALRELMGEWWGEPLPRAFELQSERS